MSPSDDNDYLFELLTNDKMVGLIDAATVNTITQKHLFYFLARFDDDIHCIKLTNKGSKIGVQDYDSAAGNPRKLLFDVIQKFNTDEKKAVMEALNKLTFNNLSVNKVLGDVDLPRVLQADLNETNAKKRINLFPPKYITAANSAKRQAETALTKLKKADTAAAGAPGAPGAALVASLKIDVGKAAKTYDALATAAAAEAAAAAAAAEAAAPTGTTDAELREAVEYANTHKIKAKKIADEAKTLVASDDYVELIKAADAAADPAAVAFAAAKKTRDPKKALELAQAELDKAESHNTTYQKIGDKASPGAMTAATDFKRDAESALNLAETTLDIYKTSSMLPAVISSGTKTMKTDIDDLIKKATDTLDKAKAAVEEATNAVKAAIKTALNPLDTKWVTDMEAAATTMVDKAKMLNDLASSINAEKININKGLTYKTGYGQVQFDADSTPKVELGDDESEYTAPGFFNAKWKIPPINDPSIRAQWRNKRIDKWSLNDLKLKYISLNTKLLELGKQLYDSVSGASKPILSIYSNEKALKAARDDYLIKIQLIQDEKDSITPSLPKTNLTLHGGGKQYNKKTLKYKQLKRKQTHRNQMHRTQNHRKQNHRKQTHKK